MRRDHGPRPGTDLRSALTDAGWQVLGPLAGARSDRLLAVGPDGGQRVVVHVVERDAALDDRCARLARVRSPHVAAVEGPVELAPGVRCVLVEHVDGPDLQTVARGREALADGEVIALVVPLAVALQALHDAGVAHGDVSPANVVLRADGRPVLVDALDGARPVEAGTPRYAGPERRRAATPAGDVRALATTALDLLGLDAPTGDALGQALAPAVGPIAGRPAAGELARRVHAAGPAELVRLPGADRLAGATLRRLADPSSRTVPQPARPRGRHRAPRRRAPLLVMVTVMTLAVATGLVAAVADQDGALAVSLARSLPGAASVAREPGPATVSPAPDGADVVVAAVRLTQRRASALGASDAAALAAVTVPGSPAAAADAALLERLPTLAGAVAEVEVAEAVLVDPTVDSRARVRVRSRTVLADPPTASSEGATAERETSGESDVAATTVVLVLRWWSDGWRVEEVEAVEPV